MTENGLVVKKNGKGTMITSEMDKYAGEWKNNLREGQGTFTDKEN